MPYNPARIMLRVLVCCCVVTTFASGAGAQGTADPAVKLEIRSWVDQARQRQVPVAIYTPVDRPRDRLKLAIISHGYGSRNTDYGFIARHLAAHGFYVASVQHEVEGDAPLPTTGRPYDVRMPSWQQGVDNVLFVIGQLRKVEPALDFDRLLLVGHSHGGDISMLFAREHPSLVSHVISLDNRRMPLPRADRPRVLTLRSSDQPADDGVLPTSAEQARFGTTIVTLPATIHNDMWDGATGAQKAEMLGHIDRFLSSRP